MSTSENGVAEKTKSQLSPPVFFGSAILIFLVVLFTIVMPETANTTFNTVQAWLTSNFGWFYMLSVAVFLIFSLGLAFSSYGEIKLGPDDSEPDYSYTSWFAMLFSAGMGIGLMFYGVAEPILHFDNPPIGAGGTMDAAREAMSTTFFHWGIHAWAIYAVIGMSLAYFSFRHNLPLTIRSALYPLIGERIRGPIGHTVDIFAVLGTMFGVATSLGLGVLQVNSGLNYLFDIPQSEITQLVLIAVITGCATLSVVAGLDSGIKRLSELNLFLALALLLFVLLVGPTVYLLQTLVQNVGLYLSEVVNKTFNLFAYEPNDWIGGWTLFYWAWWIAWSPFVGMFIARVSRGRTIREFVIGVLFVPVGFTFIWLTFFGNAAMWLDMGPAAGAISDAVGADISTALFKFLENFPFASVSSLIATLLVITFFVTSSDSGSLVIDIITSGGQEDPPVWQRVFWAITEGVVAAVLLVMGGLKALQTASLTAALPFSAVMLFVCYGLLKGLRLEKRKKYSMGMATSTAVHGAHVPWKSRLQTIVSYPRLDKCKMFLTQTAIPALEGVANELRETELQVDVTHSDTEVRLEISHGDVQDFVYGVRLRGYTMPEFAFPEFKSPEKSSKYYRAEVFLLDGGQDYDIYGYNKEQVIADVLNHYEKHRHFLLSTS
ncbi:choline BCCT transporter BetT [Thalassospira sp. TSL5-1]|uniref:BCCT family transporter n=1 Tax=Thalassospira sp. TSL5-1 TaxID=1544451 RepID=UPI000939ACF4|nr:choline BCCT transporter BetT [Thalassospira sp. TSL5-1]OKH88911.1 choline transporter [Thalassospira sp. TSL5-1]